MFSRRKSQGPMVAEMSDKEEHFHIHLYAMITQMLRTLDQAVSEENPRLKNVYASHPFLEGYREQIREYMQTDVAPDSAGQWWYQHLASWEARHRIHLPIRALTGVIGQRAVWYILAAGIIEEDIRFGSLFATLQDPIKFRHPSMGMLGWLFGDPDFWLTCRPLVEGSLVIVENKQDARVEWAMRLPPPIWDALRARAIEKPAPGLVHQSAESFPLLPDLILSEETREQVWQTPDLAQSGQLDALVIRGMNGSGRRTLLGSIARSLQRDILLYEGKPKETHPLIGPLSTLLGAVPILRLDPPPGETVELSHLDFYVGPVGVTLGRSGGVDGSLMKKSLTLTLPPPDYDARRRFWEASGVPIEPSDLDEIAKRFLVTGGIIQRASSLGYTYTRLDKRSSLTVADVQLALRALNRQSLDTLATRLDGVDGWDDLIVRETVRRELQALEVRCLKRERLREGAGRAFERNLNRGVRGMFRGPSGTGKTLAARALASVLQMDLYRIDLASVVNKYIGETERNLNEVFSRAEELDVILLLDEGDSLMTNRTDVSNANDRYANLETNYLLQRLEVYEGIIIITTNAAQRIDNAFVRRLDVVIDFSKPEKNERRKLWELHLPAEHEISPNLIDRVVKLCSLTGGQIRNASLFALLLSLDDNVPLNDYHLKTALQREYRNAGASYPLHNIDKEGSRPQKQSQLSLLRSSGS